MSQITTHILDTSLGKPAAHVPVRLEQKAADGYWTIIAEGTTNADGRVSDLLEKNTVLAVGIYKMVFDTEGYFKSQNIKKEEDLTEEQLEFCTDLAMFYIEERVPNISEEKSEEIKTGEDGKH